MTRTSLIIDCDPGVDDAVALLVAFACPDVLDILGVTTVGGNVGADLTARNACIIRQIARREDVPVFAGARTPLVRQPVAASHFHGESGLGDLDVFEPEGPLAAGSSAEAIIAAVMARPAGTVSMAVMGPMTNLALALHREPALAARLGTVVSMGGARREGGNITASAEYNMFADPHAADAVYRSGCRVVAIGLDATHQVRTTPERLAAVQKIDTPSARAAARLLSFSSRVEPGLFADHGPPLHDPCTIAFLLAPALFTTVPVDLQIETTSALTLGHTAVEFRVRNRAAATQWATAIDADGMFELLLDRLAR